MQKGLLRTVSGGVWSPPVVYSPRGHPGKMVKGFQFEASEESAWNQRKMIHSNPRCMKSSVHLFGERKNHSESWFKVTEEQTKKKSRYFKFTAWMRDIFPFPTSIQPYSFK